MSMSDGIHSHQAAERPTMALPTLPISHLESLKFKANQIIESIYTLQRTIEAGGNPAAMPSWPDILSKYNVILSQTHTFSSALVSPMTAQSARNVTNSHINPTNLFERIALHPNAVLTDAQLDNEVIPLVRNQQTTDVLRMENDTVRRLAEHMATRGSLGVLGPPPPAVTNGHAYAYAHAAQRKPEYEDVLRECAEIRDAHDHRIERAVRAVTMLREKFDWKQRVEVEVEEPEELDWDPRAAGTKPSGDGPGVGDEDAGMESADEDGRGGSSDEDEVEGELVNGGGDVEMTSPLNNDVQAQTPAMEGVL